MYTSCWLLPSGCTIVTSKQLLYQTIIQFNQTIVLSRNLATGSIHDYLFCNCPNWVFYLRYWELSLVFNCFKVSDVFKVIVDIIECTLTKLHSYIFSIKYYIPLWGFCIHISSLEFNSSLLHSTLYTCYSFLNSLWPNVTSKVLRNYWVATWLITYVYNL